MSAHPKTRAPCEKCGAEKMPGRGEKFCAECKELSAWQKARKYKARVVRNRQPCMRCGGVKAPGHGRRYCDACINPNPRLCLDCGIQIERPFLKCDACKAVTAEREKAANRVRSRERRRRRREAGITQKRNPTQLERDKETRRLLRREQRALEGRPLPELTQAEYESRYGHGWAQNNMRLDPAPLRSYLQEVVEAEAVGPFCAGAGVSPRTFWKIVHGEAESVTLMAYDRLCLQLGLHPDVLEVA